MLVALLLDAIWLSSKLWVSDLSHALVLALTGSGGRGNESCAGSGSGHLSMDVDEASDGNQLPRGAARGIAATRQRSNLGQPPNAKVCSLLLMA